MYIKYNKKYKERARILRRNMTQEERKLWHLFLKNHKERFLRQKVIDNYIVDFYCPNKKIVIELDGSQHYTDSGQQYDSIRTKLLNEYNLEILRFSNYEINYQFKEVCELIEYKLKNPQSLRDSPLKNPQSLRDSSLK